LIVGTIASFGARSDPRVVAWLRAHEQDIAVDPVILAELGGTAGASSHDRKSYEDQG